MILCGGIGVYRTRETKVNTLIYLVLLFAIPFSSFLFNDSHLLLHNESVEYSFLVMVWVFAVRWRIADKYTVKSLQKMAFFMLLFFALRFTKYSLVLYVDSIPRILWYAYYVPMIAMAEFSFELAAEIGFDVRRISNIVKFNKVKIICRTISVIIILLILTNDFHQLAFQFSKNYVNWNSEYIHGPVYILAVIWMATLFLSTLIFIQNFHYDYAHGKSVIVLVSVSLAGLFLGVLFLIFFPQKRILQLPEIYCFSVMAFWEAAIQSGIISSNSGYHQIFKYLSSRSVIYNNKDEAVFESLVQSELPDEDKVDHKVPLTGGYLIYSEDISELNDINEALEDTADSLEEEKTVLEAENRLAEEEARINEKNKIYDEISQIVLPETSKISLLAMEAEKKPELYERNMALICFYGSLIKRRANLAIIASENDVISSAEIRIAIGEIFGYLSLCGVKTAVNGSAYGYLNAEEVSDIADYCQHLLESVIDTLKGVIFSISETDEEIKIKFAFESYDEPEILTYNNSIKVSSFREDKTFYFTLTVGKGGAER